MNSDFKTSDAKIVDDAELCNFKEIATMDELIEECVTKDGTYDAEKL